MGPQGLSGFFFTGGVSSPVQNLLMLEVTSGGDFNHTAQNRVN